MKNNVIQEFLDKLTPEDHARIERNMYEHEAKERWLEERGYEYGTENSYSLKLLNDRGFFPIGITYMMGEETFIFKDDSLADEAWKSRILGCGGWWYGEREFTETRKEYEDEWKVNLYVVWL